MNIVSIMAHQDDEMRCLGTMLKCRARGDKLFFCTLTDGSNGFVQNPEISREDGAKIRNQEMTNLANAINAEYFNIGELDEFLYDTQEVRKKLIEVIRRTRANLIFTHYHDDYNIDHTTVSKLVRHCAMIASLPVIPTKSPSLKEHPAIFMVEPHGPFEFFPTHYVDISGYVEKKTGLLANHKSQEEAIKKALGKSLGETTEVASRFRGNLVKCEHAECFVPMQARGAIKPYSILP